MSTAYQLQLPDAIQKQLEAYAEQTGISVNQFISTAVVEKLASLANSKYIEQRAQRGSQAKFNAMLDRVPDVQAEANDMLP